jgi:nicotinamide riboside transporter PnuC
VKRRGRLTRRPYRDSAIFYGALAVVIVVVAVATGGNILEAILVALAAFILATGWTWWRFREQLEERGRR